LRALDDHNENPELDKLERDVVETANKLELARWVSAEEQHCSAQKLECSTVCPLLFSSASVTCAGLIAARREACDNWRNPGMALLKS